MYVQCRCHLQYNVHTMYIQCTYNVCTLYIHWNIGCPMYIHWMYIVHTLYVQIYNGYTMYVQCTYNVHTLYIHCTVIVINMSLNDYCLLQTICKTFILETEVDVLFPHLLIVVLQLAWNVVISSRNVFLMTMLSSSKTPDE